MNTFSSTDTIAAPATPPGRGGISVIRISGSHVKKIASELVKKNLQPRYALFTPFYDQAGDAIDEGIALFFPRPHSFTGEDVLELHGHGGPAVVDSLMRRILSLGARMARPGEFSERAFLNNKIDLTQAEAIADLINASSEQAARASMRSLQGEFSKKINELVGALIRLRTYIEASIDFVEEEIDFLADKQITENLTAIMTQFHSIESSAIQGSLLRDGLTAVIVGEPNVGKSSLLNQLSGHDRAIVTDIPGTTRDVLREHIVIDGLPIHFVDTAGLRESADPVEQEGIRRAHQEISRADLILCVVDANHERLPENISSKGHFILIRNKIDLSNEKPSVSEQKTQTVISLSAKTKEGIDLLKNHIKSFAGFKTTTEGTFSARRRHLDALTRAKHFLMSAEKQLAIRAWELFAEDLRQAQQALNEVTGEFTADDLLGQIFSNFCIGK